MPIVADIVESLATRVNPTDAADWDPVGLQLGDPDDPVESVAVCHEVTESVVARIEKDPVDLLVTYHPLLFQPTNRILVGRSPGARSFRLITAGVSLLVAHTDFDAAPGGTADALADFFGLGDLRPFGEDPETGMAAIGRYGSFDGNLGRVESMLRDEFGPVGLRISGPHHAEIDVLAVVPGSGGSFVESAAEVAQALVTGDVSHHRAVAARDMGLAIADPGHTATERPGMAALVDLVSEVFGMGVVDLTGLDPRTWG